MFIMTSKKTFSNANGTYEVLLNGQDQSTSSGDSVVSISSYQGAMCTKHSITVDAGDNSTGTITLSATAVGASVTEPVYNSDGTTQTVLDLSAGPRTVSIDTATALKSISFTNASLGGSDNVTVTISSGD